MSSSCSRRVEYDRFIPFRSAMDMDYARFALTGPSRPSRILAFNTAHETPVSKLPQFDKAIRLQKKQQRRIPKEPERVLVLNGMLVDDGLNLLDWGSNNVLAIGLEDAVISSHTSIVKAVDWCPTRSNLLASGGGRNDHCVKFWNTVNGACLNSIDASSEVCALLWDKNKSELLTSHGSPNNQLTSWNYPSMTRVAELPDHSSRVLSLAGSPLGGVVASATADETVRFSNIFETPKITKPELPFAQSVVGSIATGSFMVSKRQHIFIQTYGIEIFKIEHNCLRQMRWRLMILKKFQSLIEPNKKLQCSLWPTEQRDLEH
ncbi:WD domain, G-beta repeat [Musa troglodytarum]|uniref:WD domain, G-beta repeat n=1 Tax=Musa troglodytarum TaxID=320322 RepID=A0A9E7EA51_9LILI|nr:WD domain, G-beta repeat [Musa troglodytarum]